MKDKSKRAVIGIVCAMACTASTVAFAQSVSPGAFDDVIAVGPVDSVSASGREFMVLGRVFRSADMITLSAGEYVAVHGEMKRDGSISDTWVELLGIYVAGSDLVYEKGVITEIKPFLGQLTIGGSRVGYTASMYTANGAGPALGDVVAVSGIQPSSQSPLLVNSLMASADRARDALLQGGGVRSASIQGSGVQSASIQGSGFRSASIQHGLGSN